MFAGLHLQLHEARIGLIGFNGAGKTSLLRMLAGLDVPQQGRMVRQGETLHSAERGHAPSRRVGLMFQNPDDQIIFPPCRKSCSCPGAAPTPAAAGRRRPRRWRIFYSSAAWRIGPSGPWAA